MTPNTERDPTQAEINRVDAYRRREHMKKVNADMEEEWHKKPTMTFHGIPLTELLPHLSDEGIMGLCSYCHQATDWSEVMAEKEPDATPPSSED